MVYKMDRKEFLRYTKELFGECHNTLKIKNSDYANDAGEPFRNFRQVEQLGIATTEVGLLTRMTDKMARISNLVTKEEPDVKDETIHDTLMDLINYSAILSAYLEEKHPSKKGGFIRSKLKPKPKPEPEPKAETKTPTLERMETEKKINIINSGPSSSPDTLESGKADDAEPETIDFKCKRCGAIDTCFAGEDGKPVMDVCQKCDSEGHGPDLTTAGHPSAMEPESIEHIGPLVKKEDSGPLSSRYKTFAQDNKDKKEETKDDDKPSETASRF